jgi:hypothetical protein
MTTAASTPRQIAFATENGPCSITLEAGHGCLVTEEGDHGTPIDEDTLRAHLTGPGGAEDVIALIEDRTSAITDASARARVADALNDWRREHYAG